MPNIRQNDFNPIEQQMNCCAYCGAILNSPTCDHVPSRVFLDEPYPPNLPSVPACESCNISFSRDEVFLACLIDFAHTGASSAGLCERIKTKKALEHSPGLEIDILQQRIIITNGQISLTLTDLFKERVENVLSKLARGHAAYELNLPILTPPLELKYKPICTMTTAER